MKLLFVSAAIALSGVDAFAGPSRVARSSRVTMVVKPHAPIAGTTTVNGRTIVLPRFDEECAYTGITLTRYMIEFSRANPEMVELESIFASIQTACKTISNLVRRSAMTGLTGLQGGGGAMNIQGEEQKKLDLITNDVLKNALRFSGKMGVLASEEEDVPVQMDDTGDAYAASRAKDIVIEEGNKYVAVFDPLDGSSNVDAGIPTGTIFGIFDEGDTNCVIDDSSTLSAEAQECLASTLKPGNALIASGYCLYSSATHFVFTLGAGVQGFTLDETIGEFILTHPDITLPPRGKIYSLNEGNRWSWDDALRDYVTAIQKGEGESKVAYTSRYIGSMVGDVHRTLLYGGIFAYAGDKKNVNGKLRLLYEAAPMSFLIEQAGGLAVTGLHRIMDIIPSGVHQRVPVIMGSTDDVAECQKYYKAEAAKNPAMKQRCDARMAPLIKVTA
ncbi:chloroplast fructose-1,6-bisphosphatase [Pavlovales sp. CCMP2436]|nr:chloroplast fructose-1,6-bisphosphatase [Pavlovales sp. CCMP2436]|mmetsp:Transcript_41961/g.103513  ORF Transcript_41961/g.103513 Transcript_41961/m.103513 type:complete len:444 (+) Transcript_41961:54-1385(+)